MEIGGDKQEEAQRRRGGVRTLLLSVLLVSQGVVAVFCC